MTFGISRLLLGKQLVTFTPAWKAYRTRITATTLFFWVLSQGCLHGGAGMAQWWDHPLPTNEARFRFPDSASYVSWVFRWFSSLLREHFFQLLGFFPLLKNQHFQIPIWPVIRGQQVCQSFVSRSRLLSVTLVKQSWLIEIDWLIDWSIDWLIDRSIDRSISCRFICHVKFSWEASGRKHAPIVWPLS